MPALVLFLIRHALIGFVIAAAFVAFLLFNNVSNLATLAARDSGGVLAVALLTFFTGLTFSSVQMGFAVMLAGREEDEDGGDKGRLIRLLSAWFVDPIREVLHPQRLQPVPHHAGKKRRGQGRG